MMSPLFYSSHGSKYGTPGDAPEGTFCLARWLEGPDPVVVCAERELACLPLESLACLASARAVTRDVSMSVLGHRLAVCGGIRTNVATSSANIVASSTAAGAPAINAGASSTEAASVMPWYERPYVEVAVHAAAASVVHAIDPLLDDDPLAVSLAVARRGNGSPRRTAGQLMCDAHRAAAVSALPDPSVMGKGKAFIAKAAVASGVGTSPRRQSNATPGSTAGGASDADTSGLFRDSLLTLFEAPATLSTCAAASLPSQQLLTALGAWLTPKAGLRTDGHVPAPANWQQLLRSCNVRHNSMSAANASAALGDDLVGGAAVINLCGRLFSGVLQPHHIAGMLLPSCRAVLVIDGAQTEASLRREVRLHAAVGGVDAPQSVGGWDVADPWVVAALLALCGVGTTLHTQWPSSHVSNELLLVSAVLRGAASCSPPLSLAESVRSVFVHSASPLAAAGAQGALGTTVPLKSVDLSAEAAGSDITADTTSSFYTALRLKDRVRFNPVVYGLPQTALLPL
jgi:hypothetical protein